jgi:acyl carrier protein
VNRDDAHALLGRLLQEIAPEIDLDSMDFLNLVTALSEETGIEVPERDYPRLATLDGFVDYLVAVG